MERTAVTTDRLVLRPGERTDGAAMASILDEVVVAAMGWPPGFVDGYVRLFGRRRPPRRCLVVCDRRDGRPLGMVSHGAAHEAWTIGIMLGPGGRGRGLGREALGAALPWVRAAGAPMAVLETAVANVAMRRTAEAVGFRPAGTQQARPLPDGTAVPAVLYVREW